MALQEVESAEWARKVFGNEYDYYFTTTDWVQRVGVAVKKSKGFSVTTAEYKALAAASGSICCGLIFMNGSI